MLNIINNKYIKIFIITLLIFSFSLNFIAIPKSQASATLVAYGGVKFAEFMMILAATGIVMKDITDGKEIFDDLMSKPSVKGRYQQEPDDDKWGLKEFLKTGIVTSALSFFTEAVIDHFNSNTKFDEQDYTSPSYGKLVKKINLTSDSVTSSPKEYKVNNNLSYSYRFTLSLDSPQYRYVHRLSRFPYDLIYNDYIFYYSPYKKAGTFFNKYPIQSELVTFKKEFGSYYELYTMFRYFDDDPNLIDSSDVRIDRSYYDKPISKSKYNIKVGSSFANLTPSENNKKLEIGHITDRLDNLEKITRANGEVEYRTSETIDQIYGKIIDLSTQQNIKETSAPYTIVEKEGQTIIKYDRPPNPNPDPSPNPNPDPSPDSSFFTKLGDTLVSIIVPPPNYFETKIGELENNFTGKLLIGADNNVLKSIASFIPKPLPTLYVKNAKIIDPHLINSKNELIKSWLRGLLWIYVILYNMDKAYFLVRGTGFIDRKSLNEAMKKKGE